MAQKVKLVVDAGDPPVERKILAKSILDISDSLKKLSASGLNRKAIIALLRDSTGQYKQTIEEVLNGLETLAKDYTK